MLNDLAIRTRLTGFTILLILVVGLSLLMLSRHSAMRMANTMADHTLRMKIEGDISSARARLACEWGGLRLHDGVLVDGRQQPVADRFDLVDTLSRELGVLTTVFAREGGDFTRVSTSVRLPDGQRAVGTVLGRDSAAFAPVSAGQRYIGEAWILGAPYLTVYDPILDASGEVIGLLFLGISREQIDTIVGQGVRQMLGQLSLGLVVVIGLGLVASFFLSRMIINPVRQVADTLREIAQGEGDLTRRLKAGGRNELGDLIQAFNAFADKIHGLVRQVSSTSSQVAAAAEQLYATTDQTSEQVRRQHSETEQVATAMNEMAATVQEVARNAAEAAQAASGTRAEAVSGEAVVQQTIRSIEDLANQVESATQVIGRLSEDSENIGKVLEVIRGVAEQTNLLALNAAIEAARAGEQGRGFAVVADEVRTLAGRTQSSAKEIQAMIERLQGSAAGAVTVMEDGRGKARDSVIQAGKAGQSLQAISSAVNSINDMNAQIASAAEQQSAVTEEINRNITNIAQSVEQTSSGSDQVARASEELARLAAELQSVVGRFRV